MFGSTRVLRLKFSAYAIKLKSFGNTVEEESQSQNGAKRWIHPELNGKDL